MKTSQGILRCRSCGSPDLAPVLSLGDLPLANALIEPGDLGRAEERFPLDLLFCPACALVQIGETVPPEKLFAHYAYASSFSDTMLAHARDLSGRLVAERTLGPDSLVVEIASNDGYLLGNYLAAGVPVLGIEPAANIAAIALKKGLPTLIDFFDEALALRLAGDGRQADVIHAHNVFAHVPDPNGFAAGLRHLLKPDGVAVVEAPYVRDLVDRLEFDTIYHEHYSYFSLSSVQALVARHGLAVVGVEWSPIHGGSLAYRIAHEGRPVSPRVAERAAAEEAAGLRGLAYYEGFGERVGALKEELVARLRELKAEGARIAAYGASAKGSTLMNAFGIGSDILDFAVDRSTLKQGRFTPGNHLPILPPEALLARRPDYALLLSWNFADEILAQQAAYRAAGGRFIIPVPAVTIV